MCHPIHMCQLECFTRNVFVCVGMCESLGLGPRRIGLGVAQHAYQVFEPLTYILLGHHSPSMPHPMSTLVIRFPALCTDDDLGTILDAATETTWWFNDHGMLASRSIQANAFSNPIALTQCRQSVTQCSQSDRFSSVSSVQLGQFSAIRLSSFHFISFHSQLDHPRVKLS